MMRFRAGERIEMPGKFRPLLSVLLAALLPAPSSVHFLPGQSRSPKPVLIRDTEKAEEKEEAEPGKAKEINPALAKENLKIGDFYLKRKNYNAALERYRDAVEYEPSLLNAYEALVRVYEKLGESSKAAEAYREFIRRNPDSTKIPEINSRIAKLEKRG